MTPKSIGTYANKVKEIDYFYPQHDRTSCNDTNLYNASCFMMSPRCNRCEALQYLQEHTAMFAETDDGKSIMTVNSEAIAASLVYSNSHRNGYSAICGIAFTLIDNKMHFDKQQFIEFAVPKFESLGIVFNVELNPGGAQS